VKLWKSSTVRLYDERVDEHLKRLFSMASAEWPFPKWEFQIGKTGAYRTEEQQAVAVKSGASKTMKSKHREGKAIDITIYKAGTEEAIWDRNTYIMVAGFIICCANQTCADIRWGGDWDEDGIILEKDNWEVDLVHYEIKK
jgi:hypothetical protein